MFAAPFVTLCARSVGRTQPPMFIGVLFQGAGYVAASFASKIWHLYLSQGILVGLGIGFLYIPSIAIIPQWFDRKRSLASAVSASGSGIGGLVFALSTGKMIRDLSLAWALRITGIVLTTASFVAVSLVRDRDNIIQPEQSLFSLKILRKGQVLLLLAWAFISLFGYITIQFSMSAFARSIGLDAAQADLVTALLSTGTACGRPIGGFASDYFGRIKVAVVLTFATGIFCFAIWLPADSLGVTCLFAILAGGIYGIFWAVSRPALDSPSGHGRRQRHFQGLTGSLQSIGPLCAEVVGLKKLPSLLSLSWLISIVPTLCRSQHMSLFLSHANASSWRSDLAEAEASRLRRRIPLSSDIQWPVLHGGRAFPLAARTIEEEYMIVRQFSVIQGHRLHHDHAKSIVFFNSLSGLWNLTRRPTREPNRSKRLEAHTPITAEECIILPPNSCSMRAVAISLCHAWRSTSTWSRYELLLTATMIFEAKCLAAGDLRQEKLSRIQLLTRSPSGVKLASVPPLCVPRTTATAAATPGSFLLPFLGVRSKLECYIDPWHYQLVVCPNLSRDSAALTPLTRRRNQHCMTAAIGRWECRQSYD